MKNTSMKTRKTKSEFGRGLTYCLGLFLAHAERGRLFSGQVVESTLKSLNSKYKLPEKTSPLWNDWNLFFNGASDHFYELEIPKNLPQSIRKRLITLRNKSLEWGHGFKYNATQEDFTWAISEAKNILRLIDKYHEVPTCKATWE